MESLLFFCFIGWVEIQLHTGNLPKLPLPQKTLQTKAFFPGNYEMKSLDKWIECVMLLTHRSTIEDQKTIENFS